MATDYFLVALLSPGGLFILIVMLLLGVGLWLALLGERRARIGLWPLLAGLLAAISILLALSAISAWATFVGRTGSGRLPDEMFWQIVPGWVLYTFAVFIFFVLFGLLFIAGPIAALLARWGRYDWLHVPAILLGVWVLLTALTGLSPSYQWGQTHRLEYFLEALVGNFLSIWGIGGAFFGGIGLVLRRRARRPVATNAPPGESAG
jgi:hypothetical protein